MKTFFYSSYITVFATLLFLAANPLWAAQKPANPAHVLFTCPLDNGKHASILVQGKSLQYQYGKDTQHPEIAVPTNAADQKDVYFARVGFSKGGYLYIRFVDGDYSYVVLSGGGDGWNREDVSVFKGDKLVSRHACATEALSNTPFDFEANTQDDTATHADFIYGQQ